MVTDPNLKSREVMEKEIWGLIDKGVECYLSLIAGRGWLCNEAEKGDTTSLSSQLRLPIHASLASNHICM